ncbi:MAG: heparinase II/III family protein [Williamsia sp.]|nr:heparinase II/III family protein [Williamsia sp.]
MIFYKNRGSGLFFRRLFLSLVFPAILQSALAYESRNLLQKSATPAQVKESLLSKTGWIKYPAYENRQGWDVFTGALKNDLIKDGEANLAYQWKVITASDYLEYERSGSRVAMEGPFGANNAALSRLVFAELAEGKGRFMNQIIDGVWQACEMSSWVLSAHLTAQKSKRSLPDNREQIIDLTSGDLGSFLSWTWYFFHNEWDKVNPVISSKVRRNIQDRILDPYTARSDYWWQAFDDKPGILVNNWNPWCNANVLACFLLLEEDKEKLAAAVYRTMISVDRFINYVKEDGACEEGPSYWGHAAGKLYDYLQLLSDATGGKVSLFTKPIVRNMGEYISRSYVGKDWVVNFADASAKGGGEAGLIYRYGKATGSTEMQEFAAYLQSRRSDKGAVNEGRDFFRTIENIACEKELVAAKPGLSNAAYTWYLQTQVCFLKNKEGFFFAAKGGHNNESHNHNDIGTFSLYVNETPVFIDAGVGTYTRQTFSNERYSIWTMQSNYHNLPLINGKPQQFGAEYQAGEVFFDPKRSTFSLDIAGAYGKDAGAKYWKRRYTLSATGLILEDDFELVEAKAPNQLNFMTWAKPDISHEGTAVVEKEGCRVQLQYDPAVFAAMVDVVPQTDARLSGVWGNELYRLQLVARKKSRSGKYKIAIRKI